MNPRVLKGEIDKIKQTDSGQETDITALEAMVGEVPSGDGNDLQSQVTALATRVKTLEDAAKEDATVPEG